MNTTTLTLIVVVLIVFLLGREITCWYFKINEITKILNDIKKQGETK